MQSIRDSLPRSVFDLKVIKELPGFISFDASGKNAEIFLNESGGHRWQRVPPTEKRGRVHTSSVTVAVLDNFQKEEVVIQDWEYNVRRYKASGKGGQHRNKVETAVELLHYETGITAKCDEERSLNSNIEIALKRLTEKVQQVKHDRQVGERSDNRKQQIGTGMRGDKIRTVQEQNSQVVNHLNGKSIPTKTYFKGFVDELY